MTYDLTFYRRKDGSQLSEERLLEFFRQYRNISSNKHQAGYDFDYENKITQVYFQIPYITKQFEDDETPQFEGLEDSRLGVHVNYARPTFFALECFPVIEDIARKLGLLIFDSQIMDTDDYPREFSAEQLFTSWSNLNTRIVIDHRKRGHTLRYVPRERLDYAWKFLTVSGTYQNKLGDYVFVPNWMVLLEDGNGQLGTCVTWTDYIPQAFPLVEWIMIGSLKRPKEHFVAKLSDVRKALGTLVIEVTEPVPHLLLQEQQLPQDVLKSLKKMPLLSIERFKAVRLDQVVDVPP